MSGARGQVPHGSATTMRPRPTPPDAGAEHHFSRTLRWSDGVQGASTLRIGNLILPDLFPTLPQPSRSGRLQQHIARRVGGRAPARPRHGSSGLRSSLRHCAGFSPILVSVRANRGACDRDRSRAGMPTARPMRRTRRAARAIARGQAGAAARRHQQEQALNGYIIKSPDGFPKMSLLLRQFGPGWGPSDAG